MALPLQGVLAGPCEVRVTEPLSLGHHIEALSTSFSHFFDTLLNFILHLPKPCPSLLITSSL